MNTDKSIHCVKCGGPIQQPPTGRPKAYCSTACRRSAEKEITRIQDRLTQLEKMAMNARLGYGMPSPGELRGIEAEITRAETRLRDLLAAAPE
jgi:predicted nucleic acid-binding Zn ribbon protein